MENLNQNLDTLLIRAVFNKNLEACKKALQNGAQPNALVLDDFPLFDLRGYSALQLAVRSNNAEIVAELLRAGADVNLPLEVYNQTYSNLLAMAAELASKDVFEKILAYSSQNAVNSASIVRKNADGEQILLPILHVLAGTSYFDYDAQNDKIKILLDKGYDVHTKDSKGRFAVHYALHVRNLTSLKLLAQYGADLDAQTDGGKKIIHALFNFDGTYFDFAYRTHRPQSFEHNGSLGGRSDKDLAQSMEDKVLMEQRLKDILDVYQGQSVLKRDRMASYDKEGLDVNKVLLAAVKNNDAFKIKQAFLYGANPFAKTGESDFGFSDYSSIIYAVEHGKVEALGVMIGEGADMNRSIIVGADKFSNILFYVAKHYSDEFGDKRPIYLRMFNLVLAATSDESLKDSYKTSVLGEFGALIVQKDKPKLLAFLMDNSLLSREDFMPIFEALIKRGYDVNVVDANGASALHKAVYNDKLEDVKLLVEHGGDLDMLDKNGKKLADVLFNPSNPTANFRKTKGEESQRLLDEIKLLYNQRKHSEPESV